MTAAGAADRRGCWVPPLAAWPISISGRMVYVPYGSARARVHGWRRRSIADADVKDAPPDATSPREAADEPDAKHIMRIGMGFMGSRLLQTAVSLDLFSVLGDRSMTADELGAALELPSRAKCDFFDALVSLRLLDREGDGQEGRYRNTPSTAVFLVKGSPQYAGGFIQLGHDKSYAEWGGLLKGLRTGEAQRQKAAPDTTGAFEDFGITEAKQASFLDCMDAMQGNNFSQLAHKFDFRAYQTVSDVGCGSAKLSVTLARRYDHLTVTALDLAPVTPHTRKRVEAAGLANRISVQTSDFFVDDLPKADVIVMSQVLHCWGLEKKMFLIRKAYNALPDNGVFIAVESTIDDARRERSYACLMSLQMMLLFGEGFGFTAADFRGWCSEVGFKRFHTIQLSPTTNGLVAHKQ